ncbi:MAG: SRPBCC domain-containing protein, partial [Thermoanaerobaculia bacterium]|nr:SRPBCC domain-containing protein [Thermoanaerobaculia bacterium]
MDAFVSRETFVRAGPERVFDAFTDIHDVLAWLADGAVIGRHEGGNWGLGWYADEESEEGYQVLGRIEVYDPGRRLVVGDLAFSTPEGDDLEGMRLSVGFVAEDGGTRVAVRQEGLGTGPGWDGYVTGIGPGWDRSLADLRRWLE